jgi:hypothetical protein
MSALAPDVRNPTRWDVDEANSNPPSKFLERFRAALVHSEGEAAAEDYAILAASANSPRDVTSTYTYPMILLASGLPSIPPEEQLAMLESEFYNTVRNHLYIRDVEALRSPTVSTRPPYMQLALACTAAAAKAQVINENGFDVSSANLFVAGVDLWGVMVEVDNREARSIDAVVAAALLAVYGVVSWDPIHDDKASRILCNIVTVCHSGNAYNKLC